MLRRSSRQCSDPPSDANHGGRSSASSHALGKGCDCAIEVKVGNHVPPEHYRVPALMDDFVNEVNRNWEKTDPVVLATYVLWRMNHIHPFINGNGRTARAASLFCALCNRRGLAKGRDTPSLQVINDVPRERADFS